MLDNAVCSGAGATRTGDYPSKKVVAFAFGVTHPRMPNGAPVLGPENKPLEVDGPLGTVFFVFYPDSRLGSDKGFGYLVTAKHVLKDTRQHVRG